MTSDTPILDGVDRFLERDRGTDLQAIRTTARREGGHHVVDGAKSRIELGRIDVTARIRALRDPGAI